MQAGILGRLIGTLGSRVKGNLGHSVMLDKFPLAMRFATDIYYVVLLL